MNQRLALLIGNSHYNDRGLSRLIAPEADIASLEAVLKNPQIGNFDAVSVYLNEPENTVRLRISSFFKRRKSSDFLLLYFSGHGIVDLDGELYFALVDSSKDSFDATAIPAYFIKKAMDNCIAKQQLIILDCCHSGAFEKAKGVIGSSVNTAHRLEGSGRIILTATDATQYAIDGEQIKGETTASVFTKYLIRGLSTGEADLDNDGEITADELYLYTHDKVISDEDTYQTPLKLGKQEGRMVVAWSKTLQTNAQLQKVAEKVRHKSHEVELHDSHDGENEPLEKKSYEAVFGKKHESKSNTQTFIENEEKRFQKTNHKYNNAQDEINYEQLKKHVKHFSVVLSEGKPSSIPDYLVDELESALCQLHGLAFQTGKMEEEAILEALNISATLNHITQSSSSRIKSGYYKNLILLGKILFQIFDSDERHSQPNAQDEINYEQLKKHVKHFSVVLSEGKPSSIPDYLVDELESALCQLHGLAFQTGKMEEEAILEALNISATLNHITQSSSDRIEAKYYKLVIELRKVLMTIFKFS